MNNHRLIRRLPFWGALGVGLCALPAHAATYTVSNLNDSSAGSLRQAIVDANKDANADTIVFGASARGTIALTSGQLTISQSVTITGPGAQLLALSGGGRSRLFNIATGAVTSMSGLTLSGGSVVGKTGGVVQLGGQPGGEARGGAILNAGTLSLKNMVLSQNSATGGAGASAGPGTEDGGGSTSAGRGGTARGGAIYNGGTLSLADTRLENNSAVGGRGGNSYTATKPDDAPEPGGKGGDAYGGAIFNANVFRLGNATFSNNTVVGGVGVGGGAGTGDEGGGTGQNPDVRDVSPSAQNATITGFQGRQLKVQLQTTTEIESTLTFSLVSGTLPAGLTLNKVTGVISGVPTELKKGVKVTFKVNDGLRDSNIATLTFNIVVPEPSSTVVTTLSDDSTLADGQISLREALDTANATSGASVITFDLPPNPAPSVRLRQGPMVMNADVTLAWKGQTPLTLIGPDGVLDILGHTAALSGLTITGSRGYRSPFSIHREATVALSNCTFDDNHISAPAARGGAISNSGTLTINGCTFSNNSALFENRFDQEGGALANYGILTINNSTLCNNISKNGGGIFNSGRLLVDSCTFTGNQSVNNGDGAIINTSSVRVTNSILVGNLPTDYRGETTNSLVGGTVEAAGLQTDDAGTAVLKNNGGATETIALLASSPAVGAGQTSLKTDQRGFVRPVGIGADIGAFELQTVSQPPAISVSSPSVREGSSGTTALTFTLTLSKASKNTVSVLVNTSQGTAKSGSDYVSVGRATVTFAPGVTTQNFVVQVVGDTTVEGDETFRLDLRSPINATLGTASGTGTILNDDGAPKLSGSAGTS